jgi:hypothetical protein
MRTQLVAARTVAEALAGMATDAEPAQAADAPSRRSPGRAGRASSRDRDAARRPARRSCADRGRQRCVRPRSRELIENGGLLPGPHAKLAGPTFEQWLGAGQ